MAKLIELAAMVTDTMGTSSPLHLTVAAPRRKTLAQAGAVDGGTYPYYIVGTVHAEHGEGVYDATAKTLTRVVTASTNADGPIPLAGGETVSITIGKKQLLWLDEVQSLSAGQKANLAATLGLAAVASSGSYGDLSGKPAAVVPRGHLWGLTVSNNATTPNTVLDIAAGEAVSVAATPALMKLSAISKNCNAAWAVGSGNGALDVGTSLGPNATYHLHEIMRSDTGVVDVLLSASATAPTMPGGYDHSRRIWSIRTNALSQIVAFKQFEDTCYWVASVLDFNGGASDVESTVALSVPTGIRVSPLIKFAAQGSSNSGNVAVRSLEMMSAESQPAPDSAGATGGSDAGVTANGSSATRPGSNQMRIVTNLLGQIGVRPYATSGGCTAMVRTYGYNDSRGKIS